MFIAVQSQRERFTLNSNAVKQEKVCLQLCGHNGVCLWLCRHKGSGLHVTVMQSNRERFLYSCAVKKERVYTLLCSPKEKQQCLVCSQLCSHVCSQKREGFVYSCVVTKGNNSAQFVYNCTVGRDVTPFCPYFIYSVFFTT